MCWQLANQLKQRVFEVTARPAALRDCKYCDQVRDSSRSAVRNIAEGFGRFRPNEFRRFLTIARGSLVETESHLDDARDLGYVTAGEFEELSGLLHRAIAATTRLMRYLETCKR